MVVMSQENLKSLYDEIEGCPFCRKEGNHLRHVFGAGVLNPDLMLVLINPTYRNLSARADYEGPRFPFIGVRQFWRVLAEGEVISRKVAYHLPLAARWTYDDSNAIQEELSLNRLFVTNIVKCCYSHSNYPSRSVIDLHVKYLAREIQIVKPKKIIAFGGLTFKTLTQLNILLREYWANGDRGVFHKETISGQEIPVIPCYFPIGRGNPKKAALVLRAFKHNDNNDREEVKINVSRLGDLDIPENASERQWLAPMTVHPAETT